MYHTNLSHKMFPEGVLDLNGQIVLHNLDCMQMFVLWKNCVWYVGSDFIFRLLRSAVGTSFVSEKIFVSFICTVSYLSSLIVAFTNRSSLVVRFADLSSRYANTSSDQMVP